MMHMCGCVETFLPRLIELGLDVYDVVQPTTPAMDIAALQAPFGDRLCFCGSVCVQTDPGLGDARRSRAGGPPPPGAVSPGGLFLGPTHAVQVGSPLENILAMYRTAGSLNEQIDESILSLAVKRQPTRSTSPNCFDRLCAKARQNVSLCRGCSRGKGEIGACVASSSVPTLGPRKK